MRPSSHAARTSTPLDTPTLADLRRRTSLKWRAYPPDVLPLWVAEMDVAPCEAVVEAVTAAMRAGDTGYDHGTRYAEALVAFAERRWGWTVDPAATRTFPDVMLGLVEVIRALTSPGDAVVVNPPVYPPFYGFPCNEGRRIVEAPLGADGRLDMVALDVAFAEATGTTAHGGGHGSGRRAVYLLCNPQNPTGTVHTRTELEAAVALAHRYGVRIVSDEIHAPISGWPRFVGRGVSSAADGTARAGNRPESAYTPLLSVEGADDGVALLSASKAWNLAGLKAAVAVGGPRAAADLRRIPEEVNHGVSHLGVIAHTAALTEGEDWLDAVLAGIARNREVLGDLLAEHLPGARYTPAEATYFAWLDCRGLPGEAGADPYRWFLREARVAVNDGAAFGTGGVGHVRLNLATSTEILTEAVRRMGTAGARS